MNLLADNPQFEMPEYGLGGDEVDSVEDDGSEDELMYRSQLSSPNHHLSSFSLLQVLSVFQHTADDGLMYLCQFQKLILISLELT